MKSLAVVAIAGVATVVALAVPSAATAHPVRAAKPAHPAAVAKPTGTIFFNRQNLAATPPVHNYRMAGDGKDVKVLASKAPLLFPASKAKKLVEEINYKPEKYEIAVGTYANKVEHTYKVNHLVELFAASPNAKYVGVELVSSNGLTQSYDITTVKGKIVAKLFTITFKDDSRQIEEAFNPKSDEIAVLSTSQSGDPISSTITTYNLHGKLLHTVVKNAHNTYSLAWSKSNNIAYATEYDVHAVKATGGTPKLLFNNSSVGLPDSGLAYSPDGKFLAYGLSTNTSSSDEQIWEATASGQDRHVINSDGYTPFWG